MTHALAPATDAPTSTRGRPLGPPTDHRQPSADHGGFDWSGAEQQVGDIAGPRYSGSGHDEPTTSGAPAHSRFLIETSGVTLAEVGGMKGVKERLDAAFLAPLRNPKLRSLYAKSLRGGLLL